VTTAAASTPTIRLDLAPSELAKLTEAVKRPVAAKRIAGEVARLLQEFRSPTASDIDSVSCLAAEMNQIGLWSSQSIAAFAEALGEDIEAEVLKAFMEHMPPGARLFLATHLRQQPYSSGRTSSRYLVRIMGRAGAERRVVVVRRSSGETLDTLGYYRVRGEDIGRATIDTQRAVDWLSRGAALSRGALRIMREAKAAAE
jgi:ribosomal protein S16